MTFLIRLAGPSCFELRIADPAKYGFNPRDILALVVHNFVKFADNNNFRRFCVQSQTNLTNFDAAVAFVVERQLVPSDDAATLERMRKLIHKAKAEIAAEDEILDDAPEWARCGLMYDPLVDPVALPTTGEDLTFVEREPIRHNLLSTSQNPFTREPLTMVEIDAFNATPEVAAKIADLKKRIAVWKAEAIAAKSE